MGVEDKHPLYTEHQDDWLQMRHTYRGERIVKEEGFRYLPATSNMIADGIEHRTSRGYQVYDAYRKRARFPGMVREAVEALIGVMHRREAEFELPAKMEFLLERATHRNESLQLLLRRINEEQLVLGRIGVIADIADRGERRGEPYLATYVAERMTNWDDGAQGKDPENLRLVVLDESEDVRGTDFTWKRKEMFRVLALGDPTVEEIDDAGTYRVALVEKGASLDAIEWQEPTTRNGRLAKIPFVMINSKDIVPDPDDPPMLELSNLALAIYRGEADYRQTLFMQGQATLVIIGNRSNKDGGPRVGANTVIEMSDGDAKFIGVNSAGLSEMRSALENDYRRAAPKSGELLDTVSRERESGEALRVRVAAKTATLNQIALAGAAGLQHILRIVAEWVGAEPEEVVVTPNLDFVDDRMPPKDLVELQSAKVGGAPISDETIHFNMRERGLTPFTYEEELEAMTRDRERSPGTSDPNGPVDQEPQEDEEQEQEQPEPAMA